MKNQHVVVAGGGIGGLAAALALARAGQRVTVLERAAQFADVGAGIQLGPNAIKVLASWGLRSAVLAQACLPESIVVRSAATGRSISRILLGGAVQQRYGEVYASVHRAALHAALLEAVQHEAGVQLHCGEELRSATQPTATNSEGNSDGVQVQTSQRSLQANALVAADGVWSSARQAVMVDGPPHATGHAAYRVLLPMAQVPAALRTQHVGVWWAPKVHVVHYPVRGGEFLNLVVLSEQPAARAVPGWASPASHAAVVQGMQQTCPALRALLDSVQAHQHPWLSWHLYDRPAARTWVQGQVALLGDAAHPMLPYLAQGAAMALEDAAALARHAALHSNWPTALQHYQLERKARCERVVATARRNGRIFHLPQPLAMARDAVLALKGTEVLGMPWLYGFGPEAASQSV